MEGFMYSKMLIIVLFGLMVVFQGCSTLKGATDGFKEDWKKLNAADGWIKENLW